MPFTVACRCTVFACPAGVQLILPGDMSLGPGGPSAEMMAVALRTAGWAADLMGVLCPEHRESHRVGRMK